MPQTFAVLAQRCHFKASPPRTPDTDPAWRGGRSRMPGTSRPSADGSGGTRAAPVGHRHTPTLPPQHEEPVGDDGGGPGELEAQGPGLPLGFDYLVSLSRHVHAAPMPVAMVQPIILACTRPGDVVFDPFTGSGTTAVAALGLGRRFVGTELSREYVRLADERVAESRRLRDGDEPVRRAS